MLPISTSCARLQGENHSINLMGIGVNSRLALRRCIAFPVVRATDPNQVLCENAAIERMQYHRPSILPAH